MSKFAAEIRDSIYAEPEKWNPTRNSYRHNGIEKDGVKVFDYGNTKLLSVISVEVKGSDVKTTYRDRWSLEKAVLWWYKNCDVKALLAGEPYQSYRRPTPPPPPPGK
ncbi:hypothetical protein R50073_24240 [Maricurvus nonylphenolicus]|uniref:hypothetical protein n=1 Tax=Maricurvus nonylphenolicus TaxID=1008307 RepID=UPI0036F31FCC